MSTSWYSFTTLWQVIFWVKFCLLNKENSLMSSESSIVYRNKSMNLEGSFISCQFSKMIATWSPMGSMRSSTMGSCPNLQCQASTSSYRTGLRCNIKAVISVIYSYNICATVVPMDLFCHAGHRCISWGSQLSKMADGFSSLVAYIVSSGTMKAIQQGESVLASINLISPYHLIRCVVSSAIVSYHQVLSGGQLKSMSIVRMIVRVSGISLADNSWGGTLHLFLDFLFENWEKHCPSVGQLQWSSFIWKNMKLIK